MLVAFCLESNSEITLRFNANGARAHTLDDIKESAGSASDIHNDLASNAGAADEVKTTCYFSIVILIVLKHVFCSVDHFAIYT